MKEEKETQEKKHYEVCTYYADINGHSKEVQVGETIPVSVCINTSFGDYSTTIQVKITDNNLELLIKEGIIKRSTNFPTVDMCIDDFIFKNKLDKVTLLMTIKALPQMTAYVVLSSIMAETFLKDKYNYLWLERGYLLNTYNLKPTLFKSEIMDSKLPLFPNRVIAE